MLWALNFTSNLFSFNEHIQNSILKMKDELSIFQRENAAYVSVFSQIYQSKHLRIYPKFVCHITHVE